jgi:LysM domain
MSATPPLGWVRIRSTDPPITIQCRLGPDAPNVTQGYGGWSEVARPRRSTLSVWQGIPALRMDLSILLDRFRIQSSIEQQIAQLERLSGPSASDGAPARVKITARGNAVPRQGRIWVIDSLSWGDRAMNAKGNRVRQQVTLGLLEYVHDVRVDQGSPAQRQVAKAKATKTRVGAPRKRVVATKGRLSTSPATAPRSAPSGGDSALSAVQTSGSAIVVATAPAPSAYGTGDDLLSIAARELGDANRWVEIAQLNGIRDPRSITPGQVIRLP